MKKLLIILLILIPTWVGAADKICYVSPSGSNTSPYDTWAKAALLPSTVDSYLSGQAPSSGHQVYIGPGTYASGLNASGAYYVSAIYYGVSTAGVSANCTGTTCQSYPALSWEVIIQPTGSTAGWNIASAATSSKAYYLKFDMSAGTGNGILTNSTDVYGKRIFVENATASTFSTDTSSVSFTCDDCKFSGSDAVIPNRLRAGNGTFNYSIFQNSPTKSLGKWQADTAGVKNTGTGTLTLNNCKVVGAPDFGVTNGSTGTTTIKNSVIHAGNLYGGANTNYCVRTDGGILNIDASIMVSGLWKPDRYTYQAAGTINDGLTSANQKIGYTGVNRRQKIGIVIPSSSNVGSGNMAYAEGLAAVLATYGKTGTYYVDTKNADWSTYLPRLRALHATYGTEIAAHTRSHSKISSTNPPLVITKAGKTINIDRAADTITVSDTVTVSGFRAKTLSAIRTELLAGGVTTVVIHADFNYYTPAASTALGEILADSGGAQASPYSVTAYKDTTLAAGLYYSEILGAKQDIDNDGQLGTAYSFAWPGNTSDVNARSMAKKAGFWSSKASLTSEAAAKWRLFDATGINVMLLASNYFGYTALSSFAALNETDTRNQIRTMGENLAQTGGIICLNAHDATEITLNQWGWILDELTTNFPEILILSNKDAMDYIKAGWTAQADVTDDGATATATYIVTTTPTDQANFTLKSTSPAISAGVFVPGVHDQAGVKDMAGQDIYGMPGIDIGAYGTIKPTMIHQGGSF